MAIIHVAWLCNRLSLLILKLWHNKIMLINIRYFLYTLVIDCIKFTLVTANNLVITGIDIFSYFNIVTLRQKLFLWILLFGISKYKVDCALWITSNFTPQTVQLMVQNLWKLMRPVKKADMKWKSTEATTWSIKCNSHPMK